MKRIQLFTYLLIFLSFGNTLKAQQFNASFSLNNPYNEITNGTIIPLTGDTNKASINLPFRYPMPTQESNIWVSVNGFATLGSIVPPAGEVNGFDNSWPAGSMFAPLWDDMIADDQTIISYKTTGEYPNRVFTLQWKNLKVEIDGSRQNFQLLLYELDYHFEYRYGSLEMSQNMSATVGANNGVGFVSASPGFNGHEFSFTTSNNNVRSGPELKLGVAYTFKSNLYIAQPRAFQNKLPVTAGAQKQWVIGYQHTSAGHLSSVILTGMNLKLTGTTNVSNVQKASVYITTTPVFSDAVMFGQPVNNPGMEFTITGTQTFGWYETYVWLALDIAPDAAAGNYIDAEISTIIYSTSPPTLPDSSNPSGYREVIAGLSGTFNIGSSGSFQTIQSAINQFASTGISGDVNIVIGADYNSALESFPVVLKEIPGSDNNRHVIIKPANNLNEVKITASSPIFSFENASNYIIDGSNNTGAHKLTLMNYKSNGKTIVFKGNNSYNTIKNVNVFASQTTSFGNGIITAENESMTTNVKTSIINCHIKDIDSSLFGNHGTGSIGVNVKGVAEYFKIDSCRFSDYGHMGIYFEQQNSYTTITNNLIYNDSIWAYGIKYGIFLINCNNANIGRNKLYGFTELVLTPNFIKAIAIKNTGSNFLVVSQNKIHNNFISFEGAFDIDFYGIDCIGDYQTEVLYNSINLKGNAYFYTTSNIKMSGSLGARINNNIFVNSRNDNENKQYNIMLSGTSPYTANYNMYFNPKPGNFVGMLGSVKYTNLINWKNTGLDMNSVINLPEFVSSTDLHLTGNSLGNMIFACPNISSVTVDIDGEPRITGTVYMGADENLLYPLPVELSSFTVESGIDGVLLNWETATETNNSGFEVERSINNIEWETRGFVKGNNTTTIRQSYTFSDMVEKEGSYNYRLKQIDNSGAFEYSKSLNVVYSMPLEYGISQNYPNPFNPETKISFTIPEKSIVNITVYDILGKTIKVLVNEEMERGKHNVSFKGSDIAGGVYFYRINAGNYNAVKKMVLLK